MCQQIIVSKRDSKNRIKEAKNNNRAEVRGANTSYRAFCTLNNTYLKAETYRDNVINRE